MSGALSNRAFTSASASNVLSPLTTRPDDIHQLNDSVWEFYKPPPHGDGIPKVEILFFHGAQLSLDREAFWKTWLSRDETVVWPIAWLAQTFPEARMLFISYDSSVGKSCGSSGQMDMYLTIENLMHNIIWNSDCKAGQKCPLIFVGHCFGGIIIKQFLIRCCELTGLEHAGDSRVQTIEMLLQHCKAIFYYSTPNAGSGMVDALAYTDKILGNFNQSMVDFLKVLSPHTARINAVFSKLRHDPKRNWKTQGIGETLKTTLRDGMRRMVVEEASARQDLDSIYWAEADHFDVSRATNNLCAIVTGLRDMIATYYDIPSSSTSEYILCKSGSHLKSALHFSSDGRCGMRDFNSIYVENTMSSPLPFGQDNKYVPIMSSIQRVQDALETELPCSVVTVHGEAGLGKTSLAKYIALQYWPHHTPQRSSSLAVFPDGVFFLPCGEGGKHRIMSLQRELLQIMGCDLEAVPANISEELDGNYTTIPTLRRRLQFKLKNMKALIILDDVWDRPVLEELILSLDEAKSVKYLLTSQIINIWPDTVKIEMERPTYEEARQILLKYTTGLSTETDFPTNVKDIADSMIKSLDFHPLTLANLGLGFCQEEGLEPEVWKTVQNSWNHEISLMKEFNKPVIYGREYPLALDVSMTRIICSLEKPAQDLLFLISALNDLRVPQSTVQYLYKCANNGDMSEYRRAINQLRNSSLVDVYNYGYRHKRPILVIHKLRALSVISQFPCEIGVLIRRALQPTTEMYKHLSAQTTLFGRWIKPVFQTATQLYNYQSARFETTLISAKYCDSAAVHDGLLNVNMVGMHMNKGFLDDARVQIPRGVDLDVEGLLKTAGEKRSLRHMVELLHPDASAEKWVHEAALCAEKVIIRFACRHELDDKSVARLIKLPEEICRRVLSFLAAILKDGYWCTSFFKHNKTFSSAHGLIVETLFTLVRDDTTSKSILGLLVNVLLGVPPGVNGILDYENADTIVMVGEGLINLALGENADINSECVPIQNFPSSDSRAFRVIEKEIPALWNAMLTMFVQKRMREFSSMPGLSNVAHDARDDSDDRRVLEKLCSTVDSSLWVNDNALATLNWLSSLAENRAYLSASPQIMARVISLLEDASKDEYPDLFASVRDVACILSNLARSREIQQKILSTYSSVVEALQCLEQKCMSDRLVTYISKVIGILDSDALHVKISHYNPPISQMRFKVIMRGRILGYFGRKTYKEFLALMDGDLFPRDVKQGFKVEIIVAKTMLKRYQDALADAHAYALEEEERYKNYPNWWKCSKAAWAMGLEGTVKLLSGKSLLPEALVDFEKAVRLLSTSKYPYGSRSGINDYHRLMYEMLKQSAYTKDLMGLDTGAREDARAAQQLQDRNLVWDWTQQLQDRNLVWDWTQSCWDNDTYYSQPEPFLFSRLSEFLENI